MKTAFIMLGSFLAGMGTMILWVRSMFKSATKEMSAIADNLPQI